MRWTKYFIPTSKETPKDAVVPSHQLMLRAGLIRQLAAGIYSYLPLGYRTLRKVEQIIREEMDRAGAIELHMPVLHPIELWHETGRTVAMGDTLLRLAGPEGDWRQQTVLGPTHEEPITEIARAYLNSYKQLPINFYQIQVKFRGEARPKSGVLRTREFLMKDAYSFHDSLSSLDEAYDAMYRAYCRIFARCGLPYLAVQAESGPIGGDASHEFMVRTAAGEDLLVLCPKCGYAANVEKAEYAAQAQDESPMEQIREVHTPSRRTIDEVTAFLGLKPSQMIKTLVYRETPKSQNAETPKPAMPVVVLVRGDHEVNENKLNRVAGATLELADEETIVGVTGAAIGFAGPHALNRAVPHRLIVDQAVAVMRNSATGACKTDYHATGVNPGRDFPLTGDNQDEKQHLVNPVNPVNVVVANVRTVKEGDRCVKCEEPRPSGRAVPRIGESPDLGLPFGGSPGEPPPSCGGALEFDKCIEVGHVFKLGTKYSDAMGATYLDKEGKPKPLIMGCYGIGLNRIMAAAIEASHDDHGIVWPVSIAPFHVLILALDPRNEQVMATAGKLHDDLAAAGLDVLFDDRDERAGFKFNDADLIGIPLRITVGHKALALGVVELKERAKPDIERLDPQEAARRAIEFVKGGLAALETVAS